MIEVENATSDDQSIISTISGGSVIWGTACSWTSYLVPKEKIFISLRSENREELHKFSKRIIPQAVWSMSFDNYECIPSDIPSNVTLSPTVDIMPGYDYAVKWARETFKKLCPEDEWMPPMPDPADIIMES